MSTLTKVFVLLLSLVSISLSMLVVTAFAQQQNWRETARDWQETALAAEAKARTVSHNAQLQHQRDLDELERAAESITALNGDKPISRIASASWSGPRPTSATSWPPNRLRSPASAAPSPS